MTDCELWEEINILLSGNQPQNPPVQNETVGPATQPAGTVPYFPQQFDMQNHQSNIQGFIQSDCNFSGNIQPLSQSQLHGQDIPEHNINGYPQQQENQQQFGGEDVFQYNRTQTTQQTFNSGGTKQPQTCLPYTPQEVEYKMLEQLQWQQQQCVPNGAQSIGNTLQGQPNMNFLQDQQNQQQKVNENTLFWPVKQYIPKCFIDDGKWFIEYLIHDAYGKRYYWYKPIIEESFVFDANGQCYVTVNYYDETGMYYPMIIPICIRQQTFSVENFSQ